MREEQVYRQIGRVLWDIGGVETGAATACALLAASSLLRPAEARFLRERMAPEERAHHRIMATWGRAWSGPRPRRPAPYAAAVWRDLATGVHLPDGYRFACCFATLHWNELNTLRTQAQVRAVLEAADAEAARDFAQIVGEEAGHVAWGRGVRARLEREAPEVARMVERHIELTGQVYPAVINRSQSRAWQRARAALGPRRVVAVGAR